MPAAGRGEGETQMSRCPNCGANARFDIASQKFVCDWCGMSMNPRDYQEKTGAGKDTYEVNVYRCPVCGGELSSTDEAATEFCSYCGATVVLDKRLDQERRPDQVIPFQVTKEECKAAYGSLMKKAFFAPSDLKDPKHIDSFRGIYIPYHSIDYNYQGTVGVQGYTSQTHGNTIYKDHYRFDVDVDAVSGGHLHDASSFFDDRIGRKVAPFDVMDRERGWQEKPFSTAYISGFYADTPDVPPELYYDMTQAEADAEVCEAATETVKRTNPEQLLQSGKVTYEDPELQHSYVRPTSVHTRTVMMPLWFLSYRFKDRVAYACVNGQTGKVFADIPIDTRKMLISSLVLAVPIFFLLECFLTMTPWATLTFASIGVSLTLILYEVFLWLVKKRDEHAEDYGYLYRENGVLKTSRTVRTKTEKENLRRDSLKTLFRARTIMIIVMLMIFVPPVLSGINFNKASQSSVWILIFLAVSIVTAALGIKRQKTKDHYWILGIMLGIQLVCFLIAKWHPIQDFLYYLCAIAAFGAILYAEFRILKEYNLASTRKMPQFERRGGDDQA
jgi:DNA-directed RNA polymerase subunit RPC12/RpoP